MTGSKVEGYRFQQILDNGEKYGAYHGNPGAVAKKIAREVYKHNELTGTKRFTIVFVKNRSMIEGGDKIYKYMCEVQKLDKPIMHLKSKNADIKDPDSYIAINYRIEVKSI